MALVLRLIMSVLFCLMTASYVQAQGAPATVEDAWIREAPPNADSMAGYLMLLNNTPHPYMLNCAKSNHFKEVEFHRTVIQEGMARMHHYETLTISPFSSLTFQPGDLHLMLMGPQDSFKAGDELVITLCILHDNTQTELDIVMPVKKHTLN